MDKINIFSTIGLLCDIIGAIILFKNGLPSNISDGSTLVVEESEKDEYKRNKRNKSIKKMAHGGLIIIIFGFILQLVGCNIHFLKWILNIE